MTPAKPAPPRELFVRHARKNGRPIVTLRALDEKDTCVVDVRFGGEGAKGAAPQSYRFADARHASTFVSEAVQALMYLGCEITDRAPA
jgi:hypothetical protein